MARSEKQVSVRLLVQTNETEITWGTDESYRLDVITSGKLIYDFTIKKKTLFIFALRINGLLCVSQFRFIAVEENVILFLSNKIRISVYIH